MGSNIVDVPNTVSKRRRRSSHVRFKEEEEIINPGIVGFYEAAPLRYFIHILKRSLAVREITMYLRIRDRHSLQSFVECQKQHYTCKISVLAILQSFVRELLW